MNFAKKLIGNEEERAVSPVIGVILMVAITVILAAVIAAFVLDLGSSQSANPQAGISYNEDTNTVTVTTIGSNTDEVYCSSSTSESGSSAGDTFNCGGTAGDSVIGVTDDGNEAVIQEL